MDEKKLTNRQIQALKTRNKIYRTAVDLMERKGFHHITVADICKAANVSVGSFYNHFPSKNHILNEVFKQADDYFRVEVAPKLKNLPAPEGIREYFRCYAQYNVNQGLDFAQQLYHIKNTLFVTPGRQMQVVLNEIIRAGQAKKELTTEISSEEMVEFLFVAMRGVLFHWCLLNGSYDLVSYVDRYISRLLKSIL